MESTESLQRKLLILKYQKTSPINDDHLTTENVKFLKRTVKHTTDTAKRLVAHKILETLKETKHTNGYIVQPHIPTDQCDNIWSLSKDVQKRLYEDVKDKEYRLSSWSLNSADWSKKVEQLYNQIEENESKAVKVALQIQRSTSDDIAVMNIKEKFKRRKLENICKNVVQNLKKRRPHQAVNNTKDCISVKSNPNLFLSSHQERNKKLHNKYKLQRKMKQLQKRKNSLHFKIEARRNKLTLLKQMIHDTKDSNINESSQQADKYLEINDNQFIKNMSLETDLIDDSSTVIKNIVSSSFFNAKDLHLNNRLTNNDTIYSESDIFNINSPNEKGDNLVECNLIDNLDLSKSINQNIIYSTIEEALQKVPDNNVKSSQIPIILIKKMTDVSFEAMIRKSPVRTRSGKAYSLTSKVTPLEVFDEIPSVKDSCDNQQQYKKKYLCLSKQKPFKSCISIKRRMGQQNSLSHKSKILKKKEYCFKNVRKQNGWSYCKSKVMKSMRRQNLDIIDTSQINASQGLSDAARLKLYDFIDETEFELYPSKINEMEYRSKRAKSCKPHNKILKHNMKNIELSKSKKRSYCRNSLKNNLGNTHYFFSKKYKQSLNLISQKPFPSNICSTNKINKSSNCKKNNVCKKNISFCLSRNKSRHEIVAIPGKKTNTKNISQVSDRQNLPQDPMEHESIWSIKTPDVPGNISLVRSHQFTDVVKTSNDRSVKKSYLDNDKSKTHFEKESMNNIKTSSTNDLMDVEYCDSKTRLEQNPKSKDVLCDLTNQPIETISKMTSENQISDGDFNLGEYNDNSFDDVNCETQIFSKEILESVSPHIDIIEGIEFLSFESENDLKTYLNKIQDTSLSTLHLESPELLEFDNDTLPEDTNEQVIFPTKTKDITKIKGWRKKIFTMDENMDPQQFLQLHWKTRLCAVMDMINQLHTDKTKYINLINKKGLDKEELIKLFKEWQQQNNQFLNEEISEPEVNEFTILTDASQFENQESVDRSMKILPYKKEILKPVVILKKFDISNKKFSIKRPQNARKSFPRVVPFFNKTKSYQQKQSKQDRKENAAIGPKDTSTTIVVPKARDFEQLNPIVIPECPLQSLDIIEESSRNISSNIEKWQLSNNKFHEETLKQHQNTVSTLQTFIDSSQSTLNIKESPVSSTIQTIHSNDSFEDMLKLPSNEFDHLSLNRPYASNKPFNKRPEKNLRIQQLLNNPPVTNLSDLPPIGKTTIENVYADMLKAKDMCPNIKTMTLPTIISQRQSFANMQNQSSIKSTSVPSRSSFQPISSDLSLNSLYFQGPPSTISYDMFQSQNSASTNISDPQTPCYVLLPIQCVVMNNKNVMNSSQPAKIVPSLTSSTKYGKRSQMQCQPLSTQTNQNFRNVNSNDQLLSTNLTSSTKSHFPTSNVHIPIPQKQNNDPFLRLSHFNGGQKNSEMNELFNEKEYLQSKQNLINLYNLIPPVSSSAKQYYSPLHTTSFLSSLSQNNNPSYFSKSHNFKDNVSPGNHSKRSSRPILRTYQGLASSDINHQSFKMHEYDEAMSKHKTLTSQTYSSSKGTLLDSLLQSEKEAKQLQSSYINHMNALANQTIQSYTKSNHPQEAVENCQKSDSVIVTHQMALAAAAALDTNINISHETNKYTSSQNVLHSNTYISDKQNKSFSQPLDLSTTMRRNEISKSENTSQNIMNSNAFSSYSNTKLYNPNCSWQKEISKPYAKNNYISEPLNNQAVRLMGPHAIRYAPSHMVEAKSSQCKIKTTHSEYHMPAMSVWQNDLPNTISKPITSKPLLHSRPEQINYQSQSSHLKFISNAKGHMLVTVSNSDKYPQQRRNVILNSASNREAKKLFDNRPSRLYPLNSECSQLQQDSSYNQPLCLIKTSPKDQTTKTRLMDIRDQGLQVTIPRDPKSFRPFLGSSINVKNNHNFKTSNQISPLGFSDHISYGNANKNTVKASLQLPITIDERSAQYSNHSLIRNSSFPSQSLNINQKGNSISSSVKSSRLSTPDIEIGLLSANQRNVLTTQQQASASLIMKLNQQERLQQHYKTYCDKLINNILEEAKNHTTVSNIQGKNTLPEYGYEQNKLVQRDSLESIKMCNPQNPINENKDKLLDISTTSSTGSLNHNSAHVISDAIKYLSRFENNTSNKEALDYKNWTFQNINRKSDMISQKTGTDLDVYPNNTAIVEPVLYENMLSKNLGWDDKGRPIMAVKPIDKSETSRKAHIVNCDEHLGIINSDEPNIRANGNNELPSVNVQISVQALQSKTLSVQTSIHTSQMNSQGQHVHVKTNFQQLENLSNPINFQTNVETVSPSNVETVSPSNVETVSPSNVETVSPSNVETVSPSNVETVSPSNVETVSPSSVETVSPSNVETVSLSNVETVSPSNVETVSPTNVKTVSPTNVETVSPTNVETVSPSNSCSNKSEIELNNRNTDDKKSLELQTPIKLIAPKSSVSNDKIKPEQSNFQHLSNKFEYLDFEMKNNKLITQTKDEIVTSVETSNKSFAQIKIVSPFPDDSNNCSSEMVNQFFPSVASEYSPPNETSALNEASNKPILENRIEIQSPKKSISEIIIGTSSFHERKHKSLSKTTDDNIRNCDITNSSVSQTTGANSILCNKIGGLVQQATVGTLISPVVTEKIGFQTIAKNVSPNELANKAISPTIILSSDDSIDSQVSSIAITTLQSHECIDKPVSLIEVLSPQELLEKSDSSAIGIESPHASVYIPNFSTIEIKSNNESVEKSMSLTMEMESPHDSIAQSGTPTTKMESPHESIGKPDPLTIKMESLPDFLCQSGPSTIEMESPHDSVDQSGPPTIEMELHHDSIDESGPQTIEMEFSHESIDNSALVLVDKLSPHETLDKLGSSTVEIVSCNEPINNPVYSSMEILCVPDSIDKPSYPILEILPSHESLDNPVCPIVKTLQLHGCRDKPIPTVEMLFPCKSSVNIPSSSTMEILTSNESIDKQVSPSIGILQPYESINRSFPTKQIEFPHKSIDKQVYPIVDLLFSQKSLDNSGSSEVKILSPNEPIDKTVYSAVQRLSYLESIDKSVSPTLELLSLHESVDKLISPIVEMLSPHESIDNPVYPTSRILYHHNSRDKPIPTIEILSPHLLIGISDSLSTMEILSIHESKDKPVPPTKILSTYESLDRPGSPKTKMLSYHESIDLLSSNEPISKLLSATTVRNLQPDEALDKLIPTIATDKSVDKPGSPKFKVISPHDKPDSLTTVKNVSPQELIDRAVSPTIKILFSHESINKMASSTTVEIISPEPLEKPSYLTNIENLSSCKSIEKTGSSLHEPLEKPVSPKTVEILSTYECLEKPISPMVIRILSPESLNKSISQTAIGTISPYSSTVSQPKVGILSSQDSTNKSLHQTTVEILSHSSADKYVLQSIDGVNSDSISKIAISVLSPQDIRDKTHFQKDETLSSKSVSQTTVEILSHQAAIDKSDIQLTAGNLLHHKSTKNSDYLTTVKLLVPHESIEKSVSPADREILSHHGSNDIVSQTITETVTSHELTNIPAVQTTLEISLPLISNDKPASQNPFEILSPHDMIDKSFSQITSRKLSPNEVADISISKMPFKTSHNVTDKLDFPNIFGTLSPLKVTEEIVSQIPDSALSYNVTDESNRTNKLVSQITAEMSIKNEVTNKVVSKITVGTSANTSDNSFNMSLNDSVNLVTDNCQPSKNKLNNSQFNDDTGKLISHVPIGTQLTNHIMSDKSASPFRIDNQSTRDKLNKSPLQIMTDRLEHNQAKQQLATRKLVNKNMMPSINIKDMYLNVKKCLSGYQNKNSLDNCIPSCIQDALPPEMWRALQPQIVKFITNCLLQSTYCDVFPCRFLVGQNIIEVNGVSSTVLNLMKAYKHNRNKIGPAEDTLSEKLQTKNRETDSMPIVGYLVPKSALSVQAGVTTIKSAIPVYVLPNKNSNENGSFENDQEKYIINVMPEKNDNMNDSFENKKKSVINPVHEKKKKPMEVDHSSVFYKEKMDNCSDLAIIRANEKILFSKNGSESLQNSNYIQNEMNSIKNHNLLLKEDHSESNICGKKRFLENHDLEHSKHNKKICLSNNIPPSEKKNVNGNIIKEKNVLSQPLTSMNDAVSKIINCTSSGYNTQSIKSHSQSGDNKRNINKTNTSSMIQLCPTLELYSHVKEGKISKRIGQEMLTTFSNEKLSNNFTQQESKNITTYESSNIVNGRNTGTKLFLNSKFHQKNYFDKYRNIISSSNLSKSLSNIQPVVICQRLEDCKKVIEVNDEFHSKTSTLNAKNPLFRSKSSKASLSEISNFENKEMRSEFVPFHLNENDQKSKACVVIEKKISIENKICEKNKEIIEKDNGILCPKLNTICSQAQENNFSIDRHYSGSLTNQPDSLSNQLTNTTVAKNSFSNLVSLNCNQIYGNIDSIDDTTFKPKNNLLHLQHESEKIISAPAITTHKNKALVNNSSVETIQYTMQKNNQKLIDLPNKQYIIENSSTQTIQNPERKLLQSKECENNKRVSKIESKICISQGKQTFSVNNSALQVLKDSEGKVSASLIDVKSNIHSHSSELNKESINSISGEYKPKVPTNWQEYKKMMGLEQQVRPIKLPPHLSNRLMSNAQIREGIMTKTSQFRENGLLENSLKSQQKISLCNNELPVKCNQIFEKSDLQKVVSDVKESQESVIIANIPDLKLNPKGHLETIVNTSVWTKTDLNYEKEISSASDEICNSSTISVSHINSLENYTTVVPKGNFEPEIQTIFPNPTLNLSKNLNSKTLDISNLLCATQTEMNENPLSTPQIISISIDDHQTSKTSHSIDDHQTSKTSHSLTLFDASNAKRPKLDFTMHVEVSNNIQPNRKHRRKSPLRSKPLPPDEQMESNDDDFYDESFDITTSPLKDNMEFRSDGYEQISISERHREFEKQRRAQQKRLFHKLSKELREDRRAFEECPNDPPAKIDILKCISYGGSYL